jgi:hypothetical protein
MSNYATTADLTTLIPTLTDHGETDFTDELTEATADVNREIEVEFIKRGFNFGDGNLRFDSDLLDGTQWKRATMYRSLAYYIMPRLSPFKPDDSFQLQMKLYKELYAEEMASEFARGIKYDGNNDGSYDENSDYYEAPQDRLYR